MLWKTALVASLYNDLMTSMLFHLRLAKCHHARHDRMYSQFTYDSCGLPPSLHMVGLVTKASLRKRRLIVIVWQPLEPISAPSSKTVGDREKVFRITRHVPRELPFGDIATEQWLTARPVEAQVCMYPTNRPTDRLFLNDHKTRKRFDRFWSFKDCRKALGTD